MKNYQKLGLLLLAAVSLVSTSLITGCKTTSTVDANGVTNTVTFVDPIRIQQAQAVIEPAASSVLRRAIQRSPQHAQEIGDFARAIGSIFCQMIAQNNFSVDYVVAAADKATANLQANVKSDDIIDAKNAAVGLYKVFAADQLTWQLPDNQWLRSICGVFCNSIDTALKDAGQPGVK